MASPDFGAMIDAAGDPAAAAEGNTPDFGQMIDAASDPASLAFGNALAQTWPARIAQGMINSVPQALDTTRAAMSGDPTAFDPSRTLPMAAMMLGVNPAVMSGDYAIPGMATRMLDNAPSTGELFKAADAGYDAFRKTGIAMDPRAVNQFSTILKQDLQSNGFTADTSPKTFATLDKIEKEQPRGAAFTANNFQALRGTLKNIAGDFNAGPDQPAAVRAISQLGQFFRQAPDAAFVAGTPADIEQARTSFANATDNYAAAKRAEALDQREYKLGLQTDATNSGKNLDNKIRQSVTQLLTNPATSAGYSPDELTRMENLVRGTRAQNYARWFGNQLGGGGGLGKTIASGIGMTTGGLLGHALGGDLRGAVEGGLLGRMAVSKAGDAAKAYENYVAQKQLDDLNSMVRMRSPVGQATAPQSLGPSAFAQTPLRAMQLYFMANPNQS